MTEPKHFGDKYLLLDTLGTGGMAEIFRGKLIGDKGFEKLIVIKKLLPQLTKNQDMVSHFIDEARLAALLQHDNIACIYDFGNIEGTYFIAMEYLFGKDLHSFMQKVKHERATMPPEYALFITSKICDAMEYAHTLTDLKGNPLNLIHRDLTPHNIFITYEGKVKVIDFGIAKNELQENKTQVGVVKGKISYMSPEQLAGAKIDHRSDIFSIGILLYEMLSGQKLYTGETGELIQKAIKAEFTPLNELLPDLPSKIYSIVEKATQRDLDKRYQSCAQMQTDLEECLFELAERVNTKTLKSFSLKIFKSEYEVENANATQVMAKTVFYSTKDDEKTEFLSAQEQDDKTQVFTPPVVQKKKSKILYIPIGAAAIILLAGLAYFFDAGPAQQQSVTVSQQQRPVKEIQPPQKSAIELRIEELLVQAGTAYGAGMLVGETGSAYSFYDDILTLDEKNKQAKRGMEKIAAQLHRSAVENIENGDFESANEIMRDLALYFPDYAGTNTIKERHTQELGNKIQEKKRLGDAALSIDRLTTPPDDCAYKYYSEIRELDPTSSLYADGMNRIADVYYEKARKAYYNKEYHTAKINVMKGLEVFPNHSQLLKLNDTLNKTVATDENELMEEIGSGVKQVGKGVEKTAKEIGKGVDSVLKKFGF